MKPPPEIVLQRVLFVLHLALSELRYLARDGKREQAFDLADALENIPGLLCNWENGHLERIVTQLRLYQDKYRAVSWQDYVKYLQEVPAPDTF